MDMKLVSILVILLIVSGNALSNDESKVVGTRTPANREAASTLHDERTGEQKLISTHNNQRRRRQIGWAISNYAAPYVANNIYNYNPYTGSAMSSVSNNYLGYPYAVNAFTGYGPFGAPYAFNEVVVGK